MLILPLNADLRLGRWPWVTLAVIVLCLLIHYAQTQSRAAVLGSVAEYCRDPAPVTAVDPIAGDAGVCQRVLGQLHQAPDTERALWRVAATLSMPVADQRDSVLASIREHYDRFVLSAPRSLDALLVYDPSRPNPIRMITSALAHADWPHVVFNMLFFFAFAATVELIVASAWRYLALMLALVLVTDLSYSLFAGFARDALPALGFSGVVMGMIGLAAYLIPRARIRTFVWVFFYAWTFFVPVWLLAAWFAGWDLYYLMTVGNGSGVNFLAHVTGAAAGYLLGRLWLSERREEIQEDLDDEIEWMRSQRHDQLGVLSSYSGGQARLAREERRREQDRLYQDTLQRVYGLAELGRHSEAISMLVDRLDLDLESEHDIHDVYARSTEWPLSLTTLNVARIYIDRLFRVRRYDQALDVCEACIGRAPEFLLGDPGHLLPLAEFAYAAGRDHLAAALVGDAARRYGRYIDPVSTRLFEARLMWERLERPDAARSIVRALLAEVTADRRAEVLRIARLMATEGPGVGLRPADIRRPCGP